MALTITQNDDGTLHYQTDGHVVLTGPDPKGEVILADGTRYNVSPLVIEVESLEHAAEVAAKIAEG